MQGPRYLPSLSGTRVVFAVLVLIGVAAAALVIQARGAGPGILLPRTPEPGPPTPPNIVLILTDDQRWDGLWAMPKTRKLLAGHGVRFTDAFVVNPLCCPSRSSILTGRYSHGTGIYTNFPPTGGFHAFDPTTTIATVLRRHGYRTALMGKYLNGYAGTKVPPGWSTWDAFTGPGRGVSYYNYAMSQGGRRIRYGSMPRDYSTDVLTRLATAFIAGTDRPFFLYFAPSAPHMPAVTAPRHADAFPSLPPFRPPSFDEADTSDKPPWLRAQAPFDAARITKEDAIRAVQARSLLPVDDAVQRIVQTLRATGKLAHTLIVFTSDNGYLYGEHRLGGKQAPYEESIRVPMILRYDPLTRGSATDRRMVLNIDLAPTFAAAAGAQMPEAEGASLLRLIRHPSAPGRRWFLIEHAEQPGSEAPTSLAGDNEGPPVPTYCAVRSRAWKYVTYIDGSGELYDLVHDPYELRNVVEDPSAKHALAVAEAALRRLCDPSPPGMGRA